MAKSQTLFTLPIGDAGQVVCFSPVERVYVLEFTSPPDNRLTTVRDVLSLTFLNYE